MTKVTSTYGTTKAGQLDRVRGGKSREDFQHDATMTKVATLTKPTETWADHLGINPGPIPTPAAITATHSLGLHWISISPERGWLNDAAEAALVTQLHDAGLHVQVVCQEAGHNYNFGLPGVSTFADWCASWVAKGVDEIAIGCEWNNPSGDFWKPAPDPAMVGAALVSGVALQRIRAKSSTIPVYLVGWSPAGGTLAPVMAMGAICQQLLSQHVVAPSAFTGAGHHPYCYEGPLTWGLPDHPEWNAFAQTPSVYKVAAAYGLTGAFNLGEFGCPSVGASSGVTFDEVHQAQTIADYFTGFARQRAAAIPIERMFLSTAIDGDASTRTLENSLGVFRSDGSEKPAASIVRTQATRPW